MIKNYSNIFKEDKLGRSKSFYFIKKLEFSEKLIIRFLLDYSSKNRVDARVCLHSERKDKLQDMVLIQHSKNFYPPHKHANRYDTYHILRGILGVIIFNNYGQITSVYKLNKGTLYKTPKNKYHLTLPLTNKVIYHEYRSGTFNRRTNCIFPKWAPKDHQSKIKFKQKILKKINEKN